MTELIKTITKDDGSIAVSGRELYNFLLIETPYTQWFTRMIGYGFVRNVDFIGLSQKSEKPIGGRPTVDHVITLDMAKEISMLQRNEKGKQARQYFIEIEKRYRQNQLNLTGLSPQTQTVLRMAQSLAIQERQLNQVSGKVDSIANIVAASPLNWRRVTRDLVHQIAKIRLDDYQITQNDIYRDVEIRGNFSLDRRLTNLRNRMALAGATQTQIFKTNKIDVIANDRRLTEIYLAVVKDHAIRYHVWDNNYNTDTQLNLF